MLLRTSTPEMLVSCHERRGVLIRNVLTVSKSARNLQAYQRTCKQSLQRCRYRKIVDMQM